LSFSVKISPSVAEVGTAPVPGGHASISSPLSTTLIYGDEDAILVDPPWHIDAVDEVVRWVGDFDRNLRAIYITHGHGDHWLGAAAVAHRFPVAQVRATISTIDYMYRYSRRRRQLWDDRFPGQVATGQVTVRPTDGDALVLEDEDIEVVALGHTDTDDTTALWVPSIALLVAGDAVYDRCHLALNEMDGSGAERWLAALAALQDRGAAAVVAGHAEPSSRHEAQSIAATADYISQFLEMRRRDLDPRRLFDQMLELYPDYVNPKALWRSIVALIP
jgi:glyoxylase-like metal-dependent hydrolase (beta-lactamase superfamily II)